MVPTTTWAKASAATLADAELPDEAEVVAAYLHLRAWTDSLQPPPPDDPAARLPLSSSAGVIVTYRRFGRIVGSATAMPSRTGRDLMVRRAAGRAMGQVLGDRAVANLPSDIRDQVGTGLTLELEVAGRAQPLLGRSFARVARQLEPGVHGVALRRGNNWAVLFPSQLRATGAADNVASRLPSLAVELGLPAAELSDLIQNHGVSIYRFHTVHLTQLEPASIPFETVRGDVLVPESAVTVRGIAAFADDLAAYLGNLITVDEMGGHDDQLPVPPGGRSIGMLGDYRPIADAYRPLSAPPLEQALTTFALLRYAAAPVVDEQLAHEAIRWSGRLLDDLASIAQSDSSALADPMVIAAVALAVTAAAEHGALQPEHLALGEAAAHRLAAVVGAESPPRDPIAHAMAAAAVARLLLVEDTPPVDAATARRFIDRAWEATPEHQHVNLLPWIGWAELDFAAATDAPLANAESLRQMRMLLDQARVTDGDARALPDVYGGFALSGSIGNRPTVHTTRPASFMATMLRIAELTPPDEAPLAVGRHLQTMRFLLQLSVREQSTWSMRNADRARGGLRTSTWNSDMPVAAQAMGLLTAAETLMSLASEQ